MPACASMTTQRSGPRNFTPPLDCAPLDSHQHLLHRALGDVELLRVARAQDDIGIRPVLRSKNGYLPIATSGLALAISPSWLPMSPSRAFARTVSDSMRTPVLSLGATSSSMACMIEGTPAMTMTLPIQMPGAPDTLLTTRSAPLGMRVMRRRASFISVPVARQTLLHDRERARIDVDRHAERLGDAVGGDVVVGRPDAAGGEDVGVAVPQRVERIDDRALLVADHADLHEIDADRGQIFRDIADVLVLGAAGQDFVADHQQGGGDDLLGRRDFQF